MCLNADGMRTDYSLDIMTEKDVISVIMADTKTPDIKLNVKIPLTNARQEKFCQLYVISPFGIHNIYFEAGYKSNSDAHALQNAFRLLRNDKVRRRIKWLNDERNIRLGLDGDNVIRGLYATRDKIADGQLMRDRQGRPVTQMVDMGKGKVEMCVVYKIDVAGFTRISELLAKYHNLLTDRVEVTDNRVREEVLEQQADDIIANLQVSKAMRSTIKVQKRQSVNIHDYPVDESGKVDTTPYESPRVRPEDVPEA